MCTVTCRPPISTVAVPVVGNGGAELDAGSAPPPDEQASVTMTAIAAVTARTVCQP
jgi:hypothetical protein